MSTWAERQLQKAGQATPVVAPADTTKKSWADRQLEKMGGAAPVATDTTQEPVGPSFKPVQPPVDMEMNPLWTFGKKTASTLWNQMLPSMSLALQVGINKGLEAVEWAADNTIGRIPGWNKVEQFLNENVGEAPKLSDLQEKYLLQDAVAYAQQRKTADAEWTKNVVNTWSQVDDFGSGVNWMVGSIAQLAPQVLGAVVTGGGSSIGQEVGSIYLDQLETIAKENNMTVQQVVDSEKDEAAIAIMAGVVAGTIEYAGAKVSVGKYGSEAIKKFMNSPQGKAFRHKMVQYAVKTGTAATTEAVTEGAQTVVEHAGKVARSDKSFLENRVTITNEILSPETQEDIKESMRQGAIGGSAVHTVSSAVGADKQLNIPQGPANEDFVTNVLVPDDSKKGPRQVPKPLIVQQDAEKAVTPQVSEYREMMVKDEKGDVVLDKNNVPRTQKVRDVDTGLVEAKTGLKQLIQQVDDPTGLAPQFYYKGKPMRASTPQEANAEILAISSADAKVVYPVTGKINIQKAATNNDGTTVYSTGLNDASTGYPVLVKENPNAVGPQFSAYEGGVVGNSVEEVTNKIQDIGTPNVSSAQSKRANEIIENQGVNDVSVYHIYKDIFGYSEAQAERATNALMGKIDKTIKEHDAFHKNKTDLEKSKQTIGGKVKAKIVKPPKLTREEVFADLAGEAMDNRMATQAKTIVDNIKAVPAGGVPAGGEKTAAAGKLTIEKPTEAPPVTPISPTAIDVGPVEKAETRQYPKGKKIRGGVQYANIQDFVDDMGWKGSVYQELFDYVNSKNVAVTFKFKPGATKKGHYAPGPKEILVNNNTPLSTLGHEAIHAVLYTSGAWNNKEFLGRMNDIRDNIIKQAKIPGFAKKHMSGLSDANVKFYIDYTTKKSIQEIATFAFTRPEYARFLANVPASKNSKPGDTAWGRLKAVILEHLGKIVKLDSNALDELNAVLDEYAGVAVKEKPTTPTETKVEPPPVEPVVEKKPEAPPAPVPPLKVEKPAPVVETPKKKTLTPQRIHAAAEEAKVDYNAKAFKQISKEITGKEHLDDMNQEELAKMLEFLEFTKKQQTNAVQKQEAKSVPVQPTPGNRKEVGKGVSQQKKSTDEGAQKTEKAIADLPRVQRNAVTKAIGEKLTFGAVKKFGNKVHQIVEMKTQSGDKVFITYKGDTFFNMDDAVRKSLAGEDKKKPVAKKKLTPVEQQTGVTGMEQPAMQPAKNQTAPFIPAPKVEKVEPPPARTPAQQPTTDATETAEAVVEAMSGAYEFLPKSMPKTELLEFIGNLDEHGKPLGPAKAFAIVDQMNQLGYIKDNGKKVDILFEPVGDPAEKSAVMDSYRAQSKAASEAAKAASKTTIVGQAQKDMIDNIRDFINQSPEGIKNDLNELTSAVAKAYSVSLGTAKGLISSARNASGHLSGVTPSSVAKLFVGEIKDFAKAWADMQGRKTALVALSKGFGMQINRAVETIKWYDFIYPVSYVRAVAAVVSGGISIIQAGVKLTTGSLDAKYFSPRATMFGNYLADVTKRGVTSQNFLIRKATETMQGFYRGLTYTSTEVRQQGQLRGKRQEGALIAQRWMDELYSSINRNPESLAKIHAVLDPEAYAKDPQYNTVTYGSLTNEERNVYSALRLNMDNLHNWSLAKGYISPETYAKFINDHGEINYFGRDYQQFYDDNALGEDVGAAANSMRADFSIYRHRKDFDGLQNLDLLRDPVYIAAQRMATALQNEAVTDYAEAIYSNNKIPRFASYEAWKKAGKPAGFTQLGKHGAGAKGVYGPLSGMYVPNYVAYDFKGFFLSNDLNHWYTAFKAYDRKWYRKGMKEILTVYNPAVNIGNQTSNYTFAFVNGVDTFNFNMGLQIASKETKSRGEIYQKLLAEGLLGTGITTEFANRMPASIEEQAAIARGASKKSVVKGAVKVVEKIQSQYSNIDDQAKISAYWVKTHVYGMTHDQAVTEVMQGFQNYDSVGMYFDISSKTPIFGNAFAKFTGDLGRIVGTSLSHRPLTTASYLAFIYAMGELTSALSDEDEIEKEIRQNRPFQPKIPFIDLALGWKFGKYEVNMARLIAPFQTYDKGQSEMGIWSAVDFLPYRMMVLSSGGKPSYMKFDDPLWGPIFSVWFDSDFRNVSVSDPKRLKTSKRGGTIMDIGEPEYWDEDRMNARVEFLTRSFGFVPATAYDMYHIHVSGEDYFQRKKSQMARVISNIIRVEEFNTPEAKLALKREIDSRLNELSAAFGENKRIYGKVKNEMERIAMKDITDEQRAYQVNKVLDSFKRELGYSAPRMAKVAKDLYEPMNYLKALRERDAEGQAEGKPPMFVPVKP